VVAAIFTLAIFPVKTAIIILVGLTIINLLAASLAGKLLSLTVPHPPADGMIMELPLFHRPNFRTIFGGVRMRIELFLRRAAGVIFFWPAYRLGDQLFSWRRGSNQLSLSVWTLS